MNRQLAAHRVKPADALFLGGDQRARANRVLVVERRVFAFRFGAQHLGVVLDHAVEAADQGLPGAAIEADRAIGGVGGEHLGFGVERHALEVLLPIRARGGEHLGVGGRPVDARHQRRDAAGRRRGRVGGDTVVQQRELALGIGDALLVGGGAPQHHAPGDQGQHQHDLSEK